MLPFSALLTAVHRVPLLLHRLMIAPLARFGGSSARGQFGKVPNRCLGHPRIAISPCVELSMLHSVPALRFRRDTPHPAGGRLPALLARVDAPGGEMLALHRTFLHRDGTAKAAIEPAKASLGPIWSGAVRLNPLAAELVIGEGIETAASAGKLLGLPAWAAISAGNLARGVVLPPEAQSVVIAVDRDPPGEHAAREAALRWQREGRRVRLMVPDLAGQDAADVLAEADHGAA